MIALEASVAAQGEHRSDSQPIPFCPCRRSSNARDENNSARIASKSDAAIDSVVQQGAAAPAVSQSPIQEATAMPS